MQRQPTASYLFPERALPLASAKIEIGYDVLSALSLATWGRFLKIKKLSSLSSVGPFSSCQESFNKLFLR